MTAVDPDARPSPPAPGDTPPDLPLTGICPYLVAVDGAWRSTTVAREHRCGAVAPPAILAAEKQRRLCLTADYPNCATYEAARTTRPSGVERTPTLPRPVARTTPVVLDHGRIAIAMPALRGERLSGQAILVILLALAFVAIVAARLTAGGLPGGVEGANAPTPAASFGASAGTSGHPATSRPSGSAGPSTGSPSGPVASGQGGSARPSAVGTRTYKIKSGDTLVGIAAKFGTTPKAIAKLNGLTNPAALKVGQTLKIP
ncbi:MAG: LysM peptidoglycan-binding domain-containing protein [Chloroflexota bacterium]